MASGGEDNKVPLTPDQLQEQQEMVRQLAVKENMYKKLYQMTQEVNVYGKRLNDEGKPEMSPAQAQTCLEDVRQLNSEIKMTSRELNLLGLTVEQNDAVTDIISNHLDNFLNIEEKLKVIVAKGPPPVPATSENTPAPQFKRAVKLPEFKIPIFNGSQEQWLEWSEVFRSMIHENPELDNVAKYSYLRSSVQFPAGQKSMLNNFAKSEAYYEAAWDALCKRYNDPKRIMTMLFNQLMSIKRMSGESLVELTRIIDEFSAVVTSLKLHKVTLDDLLVHLVEYRLDDLTMREWQKDSMNWADKDFERLMDFLNDQRNVFRTATVSKRPVNSSSVKPSNPKSGTSSKSFVAGSQEQCVLCQEEHPLYFCPKFKLMTARERLRAVNYHNLCRNCLMPNHQARACANQRRCRLCKERHHSTLHNAMTLNSPVADAQKSQAGLNPSVKPFRPPSPTTARSSSHMSVLKCSEVRAQVKTMPMQEALLSTVLVNVQDSSGGWKVGRALLDSGAQGCHITLSFARELGTELVPAAQTIIGVNGQTSLIRNVAKKVSFQSRYSNFSGEIFNLFVSEDITGFLPSHRIDVSKIIIPDGIILADPMFHEPAKVDMLLGTGIFHDVQLKNIIRRKDQPVFMETLLGWTVGGCFPVSMSTPVSNFTCCFTQCPTSGIEALDQKLDRLIEADSVEVSTNKILSPEQKHCLKLFDLTTKHDEEACDVTVMLPLKEEIEELESNFDNALRQFHYQEKKRLGDEQHNKKYVDSMDFLKTTDRLKKTLPLKNDGFYLPHHGVVKPSSTTHDLRVVYNGASKSKSGKSLNDCLCTGPTVQPDLFDVLLRFREGKYVLKADVAKMYLQVKVHESHRKYQKILWRKSPAEPLEHYELTRVTFGLAPSSFLATYTLVFIAMKYAEKFPEASDVILKCFYVDDFVFSCNERSSALKIRDEVRFILEQISFPLRKFLSNSPELLEGLPEDDVEMPGEDTVALKTLGVEYNPSADKMSIPMVKLGKPPKTKADLLSEIAGMFDPHGWAGPVNVVAKLFMKQVRLLKWNEELPNDVKESWNEFRDRLPALANLKIPRHAVINNPVEITLHGFSDASEAAYGAVFYIRSSDAVGNVQVTLLCSKSRVSPPKLQTIARLELCAAVLMSRLFVKIAHAWNSRFNKVVLWSDSMITLYWIAAEPSKLSVFVGHRVSAVQELTIAEGCIWRHISTEDNPADKLSRGLQPDEILDCEIWRSGPDFLKKPFSMWPVTKLEISQDEKQEASKEVRRTLVEVAANPLLILIETRFSSLVKLVNCFAYLRRLAVDSTNRCKMLSLEEVEAATENIVRIIQQTFFRDEYKFLLDSLESGESKVKFPKHSPLLQLTPYMDEEKKIICVGGRLHEAEKLTERQKHPIILPKCHFSKLIIRALHKEFLHPGNAAMLSFVRERFWILGAKSTIKQVKHECLICFRARPELSMQIMGNLPRARVEMTHPFVAAAVDYAGPMDMRTSLTKKSSITKVYVAVFKCMATGAIHLEAVTSLSTPAFIATFDRFVSRRGMCREIFSDNGTCFVGANNEFTKIYDEIEAEIGSHLVTKRIKWHFTTPLAPHAGGYYEAGVKSMKHHLIRECAGRSFDFEQLTTLLCKIEAVLNSRPLTPMSDDPNDLEVLTPSHFLHGRSNENKPERNFLPVATNRLDRYNALQQVQQKLWNSWYHEYLHELQKRPKNFREENEFRVGDLVLIKDANLPTMKWKMGRVLKLYPDKQGHVRNVLLRTPSGEKHRHVRYLAFLPSNGDSSAAGGGCSKN